MSPLFFGLLVLALTWLAVGGYLIVERHRHHNDVEAGKFRAVGCERGTITWRRFCTRPDHHYNPCNGHPRQVCRAHDKECRTTVPGICPAGMAWIKAMHGGQFCHSAKCPDKPCMNWKGMANEN